MRYTDEQLRTFARQIVQADVEDPDFIGVAEAFDEEWTDLPSDEFDEVHRAVYDLACSAVATITFPGEETEADRLARQVLALDVRYVDGVEMVALADLRRVLGDTQDGVA